MATKSTKSTTKASNKKVPAKKITSAKADAAEKPKATTRKKRTVKGSAPKIGVSLSLDPKPPSQGPVISHDDIALRAYFIAERRHKMGWRGDSATDWADAIKQLRAEALEKPLKKR
jgi:hypothetical protein